MHDTPRIGAGFAGVRARLAGELAKLWNQLDGTPDDDTPGRPRSRRRTLRIEPLESRHLMSAATAATDISAVWFQSVVADDAVDHAGAATWTAEDTIVASTDDGSSETGEANTYDWIIQFDTASLSNIGSVVETASLLVGGGIDFEVLRGLGLTGMVLARSSGAPLTAVEQWLSENVYVAGFEQDAYREGDAAASTTSASSTNQWDLTAIDAQGAWALTKGSSSVVVAVIDTGVDYNHVDLSSNIWTNPGEIAGNGIDDDHNGFVDDVHGYDFANNDGNPMDDNGHGTHVAGTIAAEANSYGVTGVASSTSIMCLKFLSANGSGYLSDAIEAVNYATMMRTTYGVNVRVDNNSWGGGSFSAAMQSAIQASNSAGILFVAAAGNSGANNDASPQYPANYDSPNVISVAATDKNGLLASFTNYGASTVDIAAPGVSIYSTTPNNTYSTYSGTSMATPHVSAVAALAWALNPNATVAQVRDAILQGADSSTSLSGKVACGGELNALKTLKLIGAGAVDQPTVGSVAASSTSVAAGATVTLTARAIAAASSPVTSVRFVLDTNGNGQYDSSDKILATSTSISGGVASAAMSTSGYAAGTYQILAAAQNSKGNWSNWVATSLTVLPSDDHGNSAAAATPVTVPSSTTGTIGAAGDTDWFKFQATAGKTYVFTVTLGTLRDSVLRLYDATGKKQLAFNDDYSGKLASQITWTAKTSGTYYLAVAGYGNRCTGTYALGAQMKGATTSVSAKSLLGEPSLGNAPSLSDATDNSSPALSEVKMAWLALSSGDWLGHGTIAVAELSSHAPIAASDALAHDEVFARLASAEASFAQEQDLHGLLVRRRNFSFDDASKPSSGVLDGSLADGLASLESSGQDAVDAIFDAMVDVSLPPAT